MNSEPKGYSYLKYSSGIFVLVVMFALLAYNNGQPKPVSHAKVSTATHSNGVKSASKPMRVGAACCKASFSRAKMLKAADTHPRISPTVAKGK